MGFRAGRRDDTPMEKGSFRKWIGALLAASVLLSTRVLADDGQFYGLMRERDLTPLGFMMQPR